MAGEKKSQSLVFSILRMSVVPILLLGIVLTLYSYRSVRAGMVYEIKKNLSGLAHTLISYYNTVDAGDFSYDTGRLMKGETELTSDYRILDDIKSDTGAELTICIGATRRLTTVMDARGNRIVGTQVKDDVVEAVLNRGEEYFGENIMVGEEEYFAYYVPIIDNAGDVIGISFAGLPARSVNHSIRDMLQGNVIICIFIILLTGALSLIMSQRIVAAIRGIRKYLGGLARREFNQQMPEEVLLRRDELGEMGHYAVDVKKSLDDMISKDVMTGLLNRRAFRDQMVCRLSQDKLSIAMCDVDFFKKVNDQYGHDVGDTVLIYVAHALRDIVGERGIVSRWGGEEFLVEFDGTGEELVKRFENLRRELQVKKFRAEEAIFQITMTFGVTDYEKSMKFDRNVKAADDLLYYGKNHGRDQIVTEQKIQK